ncbi:interferon alpha-inducible protein 27, mitochondrial-like [Physella acuta]|uniref:interferon alpha-inducible protein 27, mitochondrial-like n=1 Tax=Physella acuta TaxID=109671 RepID=UPI0027DBECB0|nr:interferon alpha-inducible protein 27, mitochondrial-like [Physella acuta]
MHLWFRVLLCSVSLACASLTNSNLLSCVIFGGLVFYISTPTLLTFFGFTKAGIPRGTVAAYLSSKASRYKIGVGFVATLQSVGASGIGFKTLVVGGLFGALMYHMIEYLY